MRNLKKTELHTVVTTESIGDFFDRGRQIARLLDQNKKIAPRHIISFEDVRDLIHFLTENKLRLVAAVRKKPRSLSDLAKALKRSRASVDKDIQQLESVGIVKCEYIANPGHGRCKLISTDTAPIQLQVQTVI